MLYATGHRTASEDQGPALLKGGSLVLRIRKLFGHPGMLLKAQAWISAGAEVVPAVWMGYSGN